MEYLGRFTRFPLLAQVERLRITAKDSDSGNKRKSLLTFPGVYQEKVHTEGWV